jgi:hypothetical protein
LHPDREDGVFWQKMGVGSYRERLNGGCAGIDLGISGKFRPGCVIRELGCKGTGFGVKTFMVRQGKKNGEV